MVLMTFEPELSCMQGSPWDYDSPTHRALDAKLCTALASIHSKGVLHSDVHEGNILVTNDGSVFILDFAGAELQAPSEQLAEERSYVETLLAMQVVSFHWPAQS